MSGYDLKFLSSIADEMIDQGYPIHGDHVHDAADEIGHWVEDYLVQEGWGLMAVQFVPRVESAADEIEQLRAENEKLRAEIERLNGDDR